MTLDIAGVPASRIAVIDAAAARSVAYGDLRDDVHRAAAALELPAKGLVFCFCSTDYQSVVNYLGSLQAGHAVALLDAGLHEELQANLIARYHPDWILNTAAADYSRLSYSAQPHTSGFRWRVESPSGAPLHPDLAVLLSTSGTTGSPKFVRLSAGNVRANADGIAAVLGISDDDRPAASLPFHYSYGLSVVNSHLVRGATLVLCSQGLTSPAFWQSVRHYQCTSFAGVPYSYQVLARLGVDRLNVPSIQVMTQAGGKLDPSLISRFHEFLNKRGGRFFVMYGQTEATARIAILPASLLPEKLGSVGLPLPGGRLRIEVDDAPASPGQEGEIIYSGPNVMMGYAESRSDLATGDVLQGTLRTGDRGRMDTDGFLYVTGRAKRDAKLFGLRVNLDDIEAYLRRHGPVAAVAGPERLILFCEFGDSEFLDRCRKAMAADLKLNHQALEFRRLPVLPLTASGKIDYATLQSCISPAEAASGPGA